MKNFSTEPKKLKSKIGRLAYQKSLKPLKINKRKPRLKLKVQI